MMAQHVIGQAALIGGGIVYRWFDLPARGAKQKFSTAKMWRR